MQPLAAVHVNLVQVVSLLLLRVEPLIITTNYSSLHPRLSPCTQHNFMYDLWTRKKQKNVYGGESLGTRLAMNLYNVHMHNQGTYCKSQCASQQDLAAVKADMQREMDQIHTQLQYWQDTILRDQHNIHNKI